MPAEWVIVLGSLAVGAVIGAVRKPRADVPAAFDSLLLFALASLVCDLLAWWQPGQRWGLNAYALGLGCLALSLWRQRGRGRPPAGAG